MQKYKIFYENCNDQSPNFGIVRYVQGYPDELSAMKVRDDFIEEGFNSWIEVYPQDTPYKSRPIGMVMI